LTEHIFPEPTTKRSPSPWALALSFLLNGLFALLLVWVAVRWREEAEKLARQQQQVEVELVQPPQPQPQPKPQQQAQQQQQQEQQKQQEEKKPEEKQQEKPPGKQPEKQPDKQQPEKPLPKPPPPQLREAQIKDKSSSDRQDPHNGANGSNVAMVLGQGPILSMRLSDQDAAQGPEGSRGPVGQELSQSEQDFVLSQILPFWKVDTHRPEGKGMVLEAIIEINPDGTLQYPLGRDDPWNPNGIIAGYAQMARLGYSYKREALEGFLLALRLSQPLRVPSGGKWPKWMKLRFAFDDL
jgi:hypothetical protein